jgi:hypothetical protein
VREIRKFIARVSKSGKLTVTYKPNISRYMDQIPSRDVRTCQCSHANSHLLQHLSSLTLSQQRALSQYPELKNPVHILISYLFKIYSNFTFSYIYIYIHTHQILSSFKFFSTKTLYTFVIFPVLPQRKRK